MRAAQIMLISLLLFAACTPAVPSKNLADRLPTEKLNLEDGDMLQLRAEPIKSTIGGAALSMYGYNRQSPGPMLVVKQGSTLKVNFTNDLAEPTTVHWHGLRHESKDDGVPGVSQDPVLPGQSYIYTLRFPDEGVFWYHPHMREDRQQDLGLYGSIVVTSQDSSFSTVDREAYLIIDDILIENRKITPFGRDHANFALMGRFGNVMLVNGQTNYSLTVKQGDTVRFAFTSAANTRPFNLSFGGLSMKLVGGDIGRYEREEEVQSIVIAPAERAIVEVTFNEPGNYKLQNINPWEQYALGQIIVEKGMPTKESQLLEYPDVQEDIAKFQPYFDKAVDHVIILNVTSRKGGKMPHMHGLTNIEWEDTMFDENKDFDADEIEWLLQDNDTGKTNDKLHYNLTPGVYKIRFVNSNESAHPMQHSIHLHGQRFLVLEQDGKRNKNLVWKDTFLIPTGSYVDILLDASNPGVWMMHCHIAEHLEAGMMASFEVN
jgi:suppressor of ftsI